MSPKSKIMVGVLGTFVALGIVVAQGKPLVEFEVDETLAIGVANILMVFVVIAVFIERACEVAVDLLTDFGLLPPKPAEGAEAGAQARRLNSSLICLGFGVAISLLGFRLVETMLTLIVAPSSSDTLNFPAYFDKVDTLLTALVLAGGSEGIHRMIEAITGEKGDAG